MRLSRMLLPMLLGMAAILYLFFRKFDPEQFKTIQWTGQAYLWLVAAFVLLVVRHFFYAFRLYTLTRGVFSYWKCMQLMVIWEFSSALTPTSKGGPFVMLFVLTNEKLAAGRTAAAVFYAVILDTGFFVLLLPVLLWFYGPPMLYPGMTSYTDVGLASGTFFFTFTTFALYWLFMIFFVFIRPQLASRAMHWLADRKILKRWSSKLNNLGEEFELAATEIRQQDWRYHLRVILGTLGAWTCKFAMINCIIIAIVPGTPVDGSTQAFIYARLLAMFVIMAFSPTPGGAGLAEMALVGFISDYVPEGIGMVVALLWRGMAYYGYLLVGAIVVPAWIASRLKRSKSPGEQPPIVTPLT
jgi:uncharacterized protein (TIRG00374 family)